MPRPERLAAIQKLQSLRGNYLISYVTSTHQGFDAQMGDEAVRFIYDHLVAKDPKQRTVDLFIHSNGGSGTVPWRL